MLTEMLGKGGQVCRPAREGQLRCPLIVRPTSEDVITGNLFQVLKVLDARWWLPQLLNQALGVQRFRQQIFRRLRIELWKNRPAYPRELLPWDEGSTQVDVTITWENPPTTVFIEMKFLSDLSRKTAGDKGNSGYPSDQLIRNIRVGLWECGWFRPTHLFKITPRNLVVLLVGPDVGHPLVTKYRRSTTLLKSIPHSDRLQGLPQTPFVGEASYSWIAMILLNNRRWLSRLERLLVDQLADYLAFKTHRIRAEPSHSQHGLFQLFN